MYTAIGCVAFVTAYLQYSCLIVSAERQLRRMREEYFRAVLRQEIGWHETSNSTGGLTSRLQVDTTLIRNGMAEKFGVVAQSVAQFLTGVAVAYTRGWKMSLVLTATFPLLIAIGHTMGVGLARAAMKQQEALANASAVAEQSISNIRTVAAFGGQERNAKKYKEKLQEARKWGVRLGAITGGGMGSLFGTEFILYGFGLWFGTTLIDAGEYDGGQVMSVFFSMLIGVYAIGQMAPEIEAIASATGAAYRVWETIDRTASIDSSSNDGLQPDGVKGIIEFRSVAFTYPSRDDVKVLDGFSLTVDAGTTVALVGASGSGKSTIAKLIERLYDPDAGSVLLDGENLRNLNVRWLRQQIGIVSQEPVLFDGSIRSNILMGLHDHSTYDEETLDAKIHNVVKMANADFIWNLPHGIDTSVGERGAMLSGGQKQRIAIARAIVSNPKILLLDEATSALDTASERQVQKALEQASENRTTIVIAHRLSTVKHATQIIVMHRGKIVESGTHNELLQRSGVYATLVQAQELAKNDSDESSEDSSDPENDEQILLVPSGKMEASDSDEKLPETPRVENPKRGAHIKSAPDIKRVKDEEKAILRKEDAEYLARPTPWRRVMQLNTPEYGFMIIGSIAAGTMGVVFPVSSLLFSGMASTFATTGDDLRNGSRLYTLMFFAMGVVNGAAFFINLFFFSLSGEGLVMRIRESYFRALLYQEIAFFDHPRRSTGALTAKLAEDATQVKGLFGQMLGVLVEFVASIVSGSIIAFFNGWKLTLAILAVFPLLGFGAYIENRQFLQSFGSGQIDQMETNKIASEAISNIITVSMLTKEKYFEDLYGEDLTGPFRKVVKAALVSGFGAAAASGGQFLVLAFGWWYGCTLVRSGEYSGVQVQNVVWSLLFASASIGRITATMPSVAKAQIAALSIFDVVDRVPELDAQGDEGACPEPTGDALFHDIEFKYPFRNNATVLKGFHVQADSGKSIALVGSSGCGKSTALALVERFYDSTAGSVSVDGEDVRQWNLKKLRQRMAIVGQEPVLFEGTIWENISYGKPDGETATQEEIQGAARRANSLKFINELPDGFQTRVGERGGLLSGGQKQRIAIARAVIRQPNLLLLDEATSALDTESEHVVQAALEDASHGRTTITIAHRLSTVQNCDKIYVIKGGSVAEQGKHSELLSKRGIYWELCQQQGLGANV
ncbi:P-loop containing nucleoside triphosphate hydrolase protein [Gonapodya prolifera JEL478]|uniref:p-loop containing nucleoside triphosphate hydrolase protein n=1 Tax=Gonapodya prolifera (strain JEL478) TaxID=1344416 RepID=A0A139A7Z3_GONPJ|nr:P-loop containing nucleoside triphosphate hydrolase protein [Gonapodya prolifera JEL478]|eukprot:KXS12912.1 P-loop containing nucleoside triphosphate hydrolase protein [Gonapodya prolifera JEL478]